ncbi:MAG: hypothetical protein ACRCXL_00970 [Dermatophilaceae bacterium]
MRGSFLLPQLFPVGNGEFQLEWHAGARHIEIVVHADGVVGVYASRGGDEVDIEVTPSRVPIPRAVVDTLGQITDDVWAAHAPVH